jgi:hypothetical protein
MINYIAKNTLYTKEDVIERIESGEESLEDLFLQIVHNQDQKRITGF